MKTLGVIVLVMVAAFATSVSAVSLPVTNASFETAPYGQFGVVPGWQCDAPAVLGQKVDNLVTNLWPLSSDGTEWALLWASNDPWNEVSQTTSNVIELGKTYTLGVDFNNGYGVSHLTGAGWDTFYVTLVAKYGGASHVLAQQVVFHSDSIWTSDLQWETFSVSYVANEEDYAGWNLGLDFVVGNPTRSCTYPWMDNVTLTSIPEPCTMALLIGGAVFAARRKKVA